MNETKDIEILATLWPSLPFFGKFANDSRLSGIRLNSAMINSVELDKEFEIFSSFEKKVPLYFDVKGRQLRVENALASKNRLELILNHDIEVKTPTMVLFKAGADNALLTKLVDKKHLIFDNPSYMPEFLVYPGESIHIREESLLVHDPLFSEYEIEKMDKAMKAGFRKYFLSYVESQNDIDEFRKFVGDSEIIAKIESKKGLAYVANDFKKEKNLSLMAARGDLYVELDKPHQILDALKLIIKKDEGAYVGSRLLLSLIHQEVPECSDLMDLSWLYDIGYRKMMLCDEICLSEERLQRAVNMMDTFRKTYCSSIVQS